MVQPETIEDLQRQFAELNISEFRGDTRIRVAPEALVDVLGHLRHQRRFDLLVDISCVDYLAYRGATDRFGLVYLVASTQTNERLTIRTFLNEPQLVVPSVVSLWPGAEWLEREVWDMFGITFDGHPDHRRILLPDEFTAHPLRKDYPLQGRGERHHFPTLSRSEA